MSLESPSDGGEEQRTAAGAINAGIGRSGSSSPEAVLKEVEKSAESLDGPERKRVDRYREGIRRATAGMLVEDCPSDMGGYYDGSKEVVAKEVLKVQDDDSIDQVIEEADYTREHEKYHAKHKHTAPLKTLDGTVQIGGKTLSPTGAIEALNVTDTSGREYVSREYQTFQDTLLAGVAARSDLTLAQVRTAVNTSKDLTKIDDRMQPEVAA